MIVEGDKLTFSSGRSTRANLAVVGLSAAPGELSVSEGYDTELANLGYLEDHYDGITEADLLDLADHMVFRWTEFRNEVSRRMGERKLSLPDGIKRITEE